MIARDKQEELYRFVASRFDMLGKYGLHLSGLCLETGGLYGQAVIEAGYNIGFVARQLAGGTNPPDGEVLEAVYEKLRAPFASYVPVGKDSHWEQDGYNLTASHLFTEHKELILRIARELWDFFPEIYERFGKDLQGMDPATFFRENMGGHAFRWVELDQDKR